MLFGYATAFYHCILSGFYLQLSRKIANIALYLLHPLHKKDVF